jgi:integrase
MLTETKAKRIKPGDKPLADGTVVGLRLLHSVSAGRGKWKLRFVSPETNNRRDMGLGAYPEVTIAEARERANEARRQIARGVDPIEEQERKQALGASSAPQALTFQAAALRVHQGLKPSWANGKHADQWINTLNAYAMPLIGERPVDSLKPADFDDVLRPIWLTKRETARRVKQRCHAVMKWCWVQGMVQGNAVDMVDTLLPKQGAKARQKEHHPAMPWRLVPIFVTSVIRKGDDVTRHLLEFVILTAARSGEARAMTWSEVDCGTQTWTVPAERMKPGVTHRVPLSARALEILRRRRELNRHPELVFPSPRGRVLTDMALTKFLRHHRAVSDTPGRIATAHGFRSSFRDWASEKGIARDLAERALAHTIRNAVEAAYHRTDLLEQRRDVMKQWAEHLTMAATAGNSVSAARRA